MRMHTTAVTKQMRCSLSLVRCIVAIMMATVTGATSLSAQWADSSRLRVFIMPPFDKQSWAVAHALNDLLFTKSGTTTIGNSWMHHLWATGGALIDMATEEPPYAPGGSVTHPYDRRMLATMLKADMLIALVPDSLRADSAVNVLISTHPMPTQGRNIGTWAISQPEKIAAAIYAAILTDTAFQRLTKSRR